MTKPIFDYKYARELCDTKKCELDETEESMNSLLKGVNRRSEVKINIICQCKHKRTLRFKELQDNTNKYPHYPIKCKECCKRISDDKRKKSNGKGETYKQRDNSIKYIQNLLSNDFDINISEESCSHDMSIKHKQNTNDEWVHLHIKSTNVESDNISSWPSRHIYKDGVIVCYDIYKKLIWIFPENYVKVKNITIRPYGDSKYNVYKVDETNVCEKMKKMYTNTTKFSFNEATEVTTKEAKLEKEYTDIREKNIKFLKFDRLTFSQTDFKIGNINFQEKTNNADKKYNTRYEFGILHVRTKRCPYKKGVNDFYWFNLAGTHQFYVIPEKEILDEKTKHETVKTHISLYSDNIKREGCRRQYGHLNIYKFNYDTINEENEKGRLLNLLGNNQENT
tara:strand:+ start:274 stop:1455 length:1182 start_codon:yes stop_codon:yes gene_type:complete